MLRRPQINFPPLSTIALAGFYFLLSNPAASQDYEVIGQSGNWRIMAQEDDFSGEQSCVVVYGDDFGIRVDVNDGKGEFYWSLPGQDGLRAYKFRFDDNAQSELQLASDIEKQLDIVMLSGRTFDRILQSNVLRIQAVTVLSSLKYLRVDLAGITTAFNGMRTQCPND